MPPADRLLEGQCGKQGEHRQRDHFLGDFQLAARETMRVTDVVRWHGESVFEQRDFPSDDGIVSSTHPPSMLQTLPAVDLLGLRIMAEVVCGDCQVSAESVTNDDGDDEIVCPNCGQKDSLKDAHEIVQEYLGYQASVALQETIQRAVKGNKFVKFETKPLPKRTFRWHAKNFLP